MKDPQRLETLRSEVLSSGLPFFVTEMCNAGINDRYLTTMEIIKQCASSGKITETARYRDLYISHFMN